MDATLPSPLRAAAACPYGLAVRLRNRAYSRGWVPRKHLPGPVISVGNLTLGGSGKTPLVAYLVQALLERQRRPAVLTRGYGRRGPRGPRILPPGRTPDRPELDIGDEAALLRRRFPWIWMGVAADRHAAGSTIAAEAPDAVFVLDDGFQHRRLHRDLDILVVDPSRPLAENRLFPLGTLREPFAELRRAHIVVVNAPPQSPEAVRALAAVRLVAGDIPVFHCIQRIGSLVPYPEWKTGGASSPPACRVAFLAAALGNPGRFRGDIERLGIEVRGSAFFRDHHRLNPGDWARCLAGARRGAVDAIIVTEKDAVKISAPPDFPLLVARQTVEFPEAAAFLEAVDGALGRADVHEHPRRAHW
ncbi:MAG: tetraacyldisaccharide 4'-kinase [Acidobacteria bacterium]|nr:tetraacyldisaccharide 4'-kinase [Acidobacteriota bacterium]